MYVLKILKHSKQVLTILIDVKQGERKKIPHVNAMQVLLIVPSVHHFSEGHS